MSREFFIDFADRNILFSNYIRGGVVTKLTDYTVGEVEDGKLFLQGTFRYFGIQ